MIQPKYSPKEALERVKLMMKYDSSKTLTENEENIKPQIKEDTAGAAVGGTLASAGAGAAYGGLASAGALGGLGTTAAGASMAVGSAFNQGMLLRGYIYNSSWNWTAGSILYLNVGSGTISSAQPAGSNNIVRVIGYAINADLIYFNPSQDWIELA